MENQQAMEKISGEGRRKLLGNFLRGSKTWFFLCMICAALSALADMITPQIIRLAVDNVIGGASTENLSSFVLSLVNSAGGIAYLRANLWVLALAVIVVAVVKAGSQ